MDMDKVIGTFSFFEEVDHTKLNPQRFTSTEFNKAYKDARPVARRYNWGNIYGDAPFYSLNTLKEYGFISVVDEEYFEIKNPKHEWDDDAPEKLEVCRYYYCFNPRLDILKGLDSRFTDRINLLKTEISERIREIKKARKALAWLKERTH